MKKALIIGVIVIAFIGVLAWAFVESSTPLPGEQILWNSRNHLPEGTQIDYKHNSQPNLVDNEPPTSGDHYPSWITKGFYDEPRPDGNLVHSQEHGYIIFWYNCDQKLTQNVIPDLIGDLYNMDSRVRGNDLVGTVLAQGIQMTTGGEGSPSASLQDLPDSFRNGSCDNLKNKIKDAINRYGNHKTIGVPRVGMDAPLILTAWGRMEKFNTWDEAKIKDFVDAYRDQGPEHTDEP